MGKGELIRAGCDHLLGKREGRESFGEGRFLRNKQKLNSNGRENQKRGGGEI